MALDQSETSPVRKAIAVLQIGDSVITTLLAASSKYLLRVLHLLCVCARRATAGRGLGAVLGPDHHSETGRIAEYRIQAPVHIAARVERRAYLETGVLVGSSGYPSLYLDPAQKSVSRLDIPSIHLGQTPNPGAGGGCVVVGAPTSRYGCYSPTKQVGISISSDRCYS